MSSNTDKAAATKGAGMYDIRNFIGLLLLIYGVILTAMGMFAEPAFEKTGGINANLITGIGLLVAGGVFMLWARLKPVVMDASAPPSEHSGGH